MKEEKEMNFILGDIEIRTAEIDDLAQVFHLGEKCFTSNTFSNLYRTWDEYEVTNHFNLETDNFIVATVDDKILGFAIGTIIEKSRSAWTYGHLLWLAVDPSLGRKGVASELFDEFTKIMREQGVRMLIVDTQADNLAALNFFRKNGFNNPIEHVYLTLNLANLKEE